jgi:DNA mismatch repair ATPase MutS
MEHAACMAMDAAPGNHEEMFAYRIVPGRTDQSHGLKVAAAAGMPPTVPRRAAALSARHREQGPLRVDGAVPADRGGLEQTDSLLTDGATGSADLTLCIRASVVDTTCPIAKMRFASGLAVAA